MGWFNDLIVRIKGDTSHLDTSLDKSQSKIRGWSSKIGGLIAGAFMVGAAAVVGFGKLIIGASDDLNDKFSAAVDGAKGALREFFSMLATGDFSHFFANLKEGYEKAHKLAQELDLFADRKAYLEYVISGKKAESAGMEEVVKDKSGKYSLQTRLEYAAKLKAIEQEILDMTIDMNNEAFDLEAQAWENRNKMSVAEAAKLYEAVNAIQDKQEQAFAEYDKYIKKYGQASFAKYSGALPGIFKFDTDVLKQYKDLMIKGETELIPKLFKAYQSEAEARTAAQDRYNSKLRLTNELLKEYVEYTRQAATTISTSAGGAQLPGLGTIIQPTPKAPSRTVNPFELAPTSGAEIPELTDLQKQWLQGWQSVADEATAYVEDAFVNLFERIGSGNFEGFGQDLLYGFGNLIANLGKMLVSFGTTMLLALTLAKTPSIPTAVAAIAVGAAAMAIGGMMIGAAQSSSFTSSSGYSSSSSSGANQSSGTISVIVEGKIQGKDIYISNKRYSDEIDRNT